MEAGEVLSKAFEVWRAMLRIILKHAQDPDSATVIPGELDPDIRLLHRQLAECSCERGRCRDCHERRRVLIWIWEKMDEGF
jgi:hypothetical protein